MIIHLIVAGSFLSLLLGVIVFYYAEHNSEKE
jgi:hypothetical protein